MTCLKDYNAYEYDYENSTNNSHRELDKQLDKRGYSNSFRLKNYFECIKTLKINSTPNRIKAYKKSKTYFTNTLEDLGINLHYILFLIIINSIFLFYYFEDRILANISFSENIAIGVETDNKTIVHIIYVISNVYFMFKNAIKKIEVIDDNNHYDNLNINIKNRYCSKGFKLNLRLFAFIVLSTLIAKVNSKGICGNVTSPQGVKECLPFSTKDYFCCLLSIVDSPSDFNTCYVVEKDTASSTEIQIGKITYRVDCTGIPDFYKYFPFEEKFKPCSTSNPKSISTCTDIEMENNAKCCLGIIKTYPDIRQCYSSIGLTANLINYTTSYGDEITLICSGLFVNLNLFGLGNLHYLLFYVALFLLGLI